MVQRWLLLLALFLCYLISGCQLVQSSQIVEGNDYQGVLFAKGQVSELHVNETDFWTPTADDVAALESGLEAFLQASADPRLGDQVLPTLAQYNRQYVGIVEEGRHKIYALFYCHTPLADLAKSLVTVLDGGDCYFQLKYDVEERTFDQLTVNGQS